MATEPKSSGKGFNDPRYRALVGELIAERKRQGFSQQALANRLNRHQQFVSRYEIGERRLDIIEFVDIARALGLDTIELIRTLPDQ
ncbi:helix-turn-helix domain-containing protein [Rhizorhapis sp. SPR117]|uniref:helix-turn-helix domain-containing protein n=1 Tax=Rhizorhapis sp. SPR117 TaxID=2912611 RepID=UPI001F1A0692|nr:helix-turn-helix domain-containing protein [Rhizorhapis sp. SPR117]